MRTHTHAYPQNPSPPLLSFFLSIESREKLTAGSALELLREYFCFPQPHTTSAFASWPNWAVPQLPTLRNWGNLQGMGRELSREAAYQSPRVTPQSGASTPGTLGRAVTEGWWLVTITGKRGVGELEEKRSRREQERDPLHGKVCKLTRMRI